jgi:hypothetical protein
MVDLENKALLLDISSRIEALETVFIGYVRVNERRTVSCQIAITLLEEYFEILHKQFASLPPLTCSKIEKILKHRIASAEKDLGHYREWQNFADSVEEFEDLSHFDRAKLKDKLTLD